MSIRFIYRCDGCEAQNECGEVYREFVSLSGRRYGFGNYVYHASPETSKPDGWIAFDIVGATYCPECWAQIQSEIEAA